MNPCSIKGLEQTLLQYVSIYPSPVNNELNLSFLARPITEMCLTDISGRVLLQEKSDTGKITIHTTALESRVYFVSIQQEGLHDVQKVIRE